MEQRFDLEVSADRPILRLDHLFPGCTALIDTGALFPVWTKTEVYLKRWERKCAKGTFCLAVLAGMLTEIFIRLHYILANWSS